MDILDMLNDYLKTNKTDEQLANEFVTLLNKGESIYKVAKLYDLSVNKAREILKNTGYTYSSFSNKWKRLNVPQKADQPKANTKNDSKINAKNDEQLAAEFVALLNSSKRQSIENVAEIFNYSPEKITEILNNTGYKYYGFSKKWKNTIPTKNTKKSKSNKKKKSSKDTSTKSTTVPLQLDGQINEIVNKLNNGIWILEAAVFYRITEGELRQLLKKNKYRFDRIFNVWTKLSKNEYLKQIADDLYNGKLTFKDIDKNGVNLNVVKMELLNSGFEYINNHANRNQNNSTNTANQEKRNDSSIIYPLITEDMLLKEEKDESLDFLLSHDDDEMSLTSIGVETKNVKSNEELFNEDDLASLREIIHNWQEKQKEDSPKINSKIETTIFMDEEIISALTKTAEMEGLSRSLIIENALKSFLNS
jgi:hypothetical protein